MYDDGMHNDGAAGDQVFGAGFTISGPEVQYYLYAENNNTGAFLPERAEHEFLSLTVQAEPAEAGDLVLNEYLPANNTGITNEKGSKKDWIEIYNRSSKTIFLDDFSLSDDKSKPSKWNFPKNLLMVPGEYKIIWADGENAVYLDPHTNFSLSGTNGQVVLGFKGAIDQESSYSTPGNDRSVGRCPDALGPFMLQSRATPGAANDCISSSSDESGSDEFFIYPNPCQNTLYLRTDNALRYSEIYDLQGQAVYRTTDPLQLDLTTLKPGFYVLKSLDANGKIHLAKFIKI
jgi:hypothetical protein